MHIITVLLSTIVIFSILKISKVFPYSFHSKLSNLKREILQTAPIGDSCFEDENVPHDKSDLESSSAWEQSLSDMEVEIGKAFHFDMKKKHDDKIEVDSKESGEDQEIVRKKNQKRCTEYLNKKRGFNG